MPAAPPHPTETARLADLRAHGILDTEPEADFDAVTRMAAALCDVPIALVSLVDEQRQWFKARVGLEIAETPREQAFCAHAILEDEILEVHDAERDVRFADNPLVQGEPHIRYYAGAPLMSSAGLPLGTLCVLDRVPRALSEAQLGNLRVLAGQVAEHLEARGRLRALARHDPEDRTVRQAPGDASTETMHSELTFCPDVDEPQRCGRFTVLRRIGQGAMATVYAAHDAELDRCIAIKLLRGDGDADMRARVQREAQALARISHPNVVQIFEVGSYGAQMFVAMELVDGPTLSAWRDGWPRGLADVVRMYVQAGRGLVAAHSVGIIHRDFKADNVIVGPDDRARLVDFGLARVLHSTARADPDAGPIGGLDVTCAGTIMGTPAYMSPEQHRSAAVDERSDQFNYCAALYEALYGRRPFAGSNLDELSAMVTAGVVDEPRPDDAVPVALHRALLRGLAPDPDQRWPSLAELLDHLERLDLGGDPDRPRERPALFGLLVASCVAIAALLTTRLGRAGSGGPTDLVLIADGLLALGLVVAWRLRDTLRVAEVHRRMIGVVLFILAVGCVGRLLGLFIGLRVAQMLVVELLLCGVSFAALACFVRRAWWPLGAVHLAGAGAALVVSPLAVDAVVLVAALALFVRLWRDELRRSASA